jgi:hypothetical protein
VWCDIVDNIPLDYTSYSNVEQAIIKNSCSQNLLPALLEDIPLQTRSHVYFQNFTAPPHFSRQVARYQIKQFLNRWIGCDGPQNWPPRSPDLTPLDSHIWDCTKNMVYERKVNTVEALLQFFDAARRMNNFDVLCKVPHFVGKQMMRSN